MKIYYINKIFIILIFQLIFLFSCKTDNTSVLNFDNNAIAEVGNKKLYMHEIESILSAKMTKEDSFLMIKEYIDNWVQKQIMLLNAEKYNISSNAELNKRIEDYKEDLILFEYQKKLLGENLDTLITYKESLDYYKTNSENFELKQNITKFVFIKVHKTDEKKYNLWNKFLKSKPEELSKMAIFAIRNEGNAFIEYDKWVSFDDIIKAVPINTYNQENFMSNKKKFKIENENFVWFINIIDFKVKDELSPFEFVRDKINEIILNKRKTALLNKIEQGMIEQAKNDKIIKINLQQYN